MKSARILRTTAVVGAVALILGAFVAAPADAKKKKKKKPTVPACAAYTPYEKGADAPITVVTDAATKDAPVTVTLATAEGLGLSSPETEDPAENGQPSHSFANVQVDSASPSTALFVRLEFPGTTDYDLFLRNPDGTSELYSAGGPPYRAPNDGTGHGGHSEGGIDGASENIDGAPVTDCQGYTVDVVSAITPGGDVTLKYWLGEAPAV